MLEHPCPARLHRPRADWRIARFDDRYCLFLLNSSNQITGAIRCGYSYPPEKAREIFRSEPWQPSTLGQPWPSTEEGSQLSPDWT